MSDEVSFYDWAPYGMTLEENEIDGRFVAEDDYNKLQSNLEATKKELVSRTHQYETFERLYQEQLARAEKAEAELEKALEQGKPYLKERYDSVCSANGRLHVENAELRAEVERLKHWDTRMEILEEMLMSGHVSMVNEKARRKLKQWREEWKAQKEGPNDA